MAAQVMHVGTITVATPPSFPTAACSSFSFFSLQAASYADASGKVPLDHADQSMFCSGEAMEKVRVKCEIMTITMACVPRVAPSPHHHHHCTITAPSLHHPARVLSQTIGCMGWPLPGQGMCVLKSCGEKA